MRNLSPEGIRRELMNLPDISRALWERVHEIPPGRVSTYGTLATALGDPVATRWVGFELLNHLHSSDCPCFRVVRATGQLGRYCQGSQDEKMARLQADGIDIVNQRVDLQLHGYAEFSGSPPLQHLKSIQEIVRSYASLVDENSVQTIAGVDVSYHGNIAFACYAETNSETGELSWSHVATRPSSFPYITSYLAYRELPVLIQLVEEVRAIRKLADAVMVDGAGIAHPRGCGVATMLGVACDLRTIGITKKLLHGSVQTTKMSCGEIRPILQHDSPIGAALRPNPRTARPIFVSPGHRIHCEQAIEQVDRVLGRRRLPDPIYWADRLSRETAKS